jgi:hypothetical protein
MSGPILPPGLTPINDFNSSSLSTATDGRFAAFFTSARKTAEATDWPLTSARLLVDEIVSLRFAEQVQNFEATCAARAGREIRRGEEDPI